MRARRTTKKARAPRSAWLITRARGGLGELLLIDVVRMRGGWIGRAIIDDAPPDAVWLIGDIFCAPGTVVDGTCHLDDVDGWLRLMGATPRWFFARQRIADHTIDL